MTAGKEPAERRRPSSLAARARELVDEALDRSPEERDRFLERACESDAELLAEARELLRCVAESEGFLEPPPPSALSGLGEPAGRSVRVGAYRVEGVLASGGMGTVYEAWQENPRRKVALKMVHPGLATPRTVARFRIEAEILANLEHPNVAQVFEAGVHVDELGRELPWFALEFVEGARSIREYVRDELLGLDRTLALFGKVCDAVQHAHLRGVIHRDLKPGNILVGANGEPKVIDFGVARATDTEAVRETLLTRSGEIVGTLRYMAPEQLSGDPSRIDARTDTYALGVLLFELLTGGSPHDLDGLPLPEAARVVRDESPRRPRSVRPDLPADLEWVLVRALEKDPDRRFASATALREELERFRRDEPVSSSPPSSIYLLRKFARRHRAGVLAASTLLAVLIGWALESDRQRGIAAAERNEARRLAEESDRLRLQAEEERARVLRLADWKRLDELREDARNLWPAAPERVPALRAWLDRAGDLIARLPSHRERLATFRDEGQPDTERALAEREAELSELLSRRELLLSDAPPPDSREHRIFELAMTSLESRIAALEGPVPEAWDFDEAETRWQHEALDQLVAGLEELGGPGGLLEDVRARLAFAESVEERTVRGPAVSERWALAVAEIADADSSPWYDGLLLSPQLGLVPLGPDPRSGLWEFAHLASGEPAVRDPDDGALVIGESTGVVLVLVPGGASVLGAQAHDPTEPHFDPMASTNEAPLDEVVLEPYLIGKYEMTQGQWLRMAGHNPSYNTPESTAHLDAGISLLNPVEQVTWEELLLVLPRFGLTLPTEAQWERAARAGTDTPWWSGSRREDLAGTENLADAYLRETNAIPNVVYESWNDGHATHAPVGSFAPNPLGLHDLLGNVREWCRDHYGDYSLPVLPGDGLRVPSGGRTRVNRGGCFVSHAALARVSIRYWNSPDEPIAMIGARVARALVP